MNEKVDERAGHVASLEQLQAQLQQREREIVELAYLRRTNGLEAVRDAVRRLGELGSPSGVLARAPRELGLDSQFDRIVLSEVAAGRLAPLALWERERERPKVPELTLALEYPLVEYEVVGSRHAELVVVAEVGARSPRLLAEIFDWSSYAVAAIVVESEVVGLLHADASASGRALDELDRELLGLASAGLGDVFERAVLREALQRHRAEMQSAVNWLSGRLRAAPPSDAAASAAANAAAELTAREREILALMARGRTNAQIAEALGVREGTVKYHVKNVLRKLGARSRADAVARYARAR